MIQQKRFHLFKGNHIITLGRPFILTAIDPPSDEYRRTEYYLFLFKIGNDCGCRIQKHCWVDRVLIGVDLRILFCLS